MGDIIEGQAQPDRFHEEECRFFTLGAGKCPYDVVPSCGPCIGFAACGRR
jgi:hypothetical protein